MADSYQTHVRIVEELLLGDDVARLATVFDALRQLREPIGTIEPEKILVKKRRLLPDVYDSSGFAASVAFGDGHELHLSLDTPPDLEPFPLDFVRERLADSGNELVPGWQLLDDIAPRILHIAVADVRPHPSAELARFTLEALRAIGATTPTDRWSCRWQISKDETIPGE